MKSATVPLKPVPVVALTSRPVTVNWAGVASSTVACAVAVAAAEAGVGAGGGAVMTGTGWVAAAGAPGAVAATPATEDTAVGVAIRGACALAVPG